MRLFSNRLLLWRRLFAVCLYMAAATIPPVTAVFIQENNTGISRKTAEILLLTVFSVLTLQPVLAARIKWLDRLFGLDTIYILHKTMGMVAGTLLAAVPFLLYSSSGWDVLTHGNYISGDAAALVLLAVVLTALLYKELRLKYETWRMMHNIGAMSALILIFIQSSYVSSHPVMYVSTVPWFLVALTAYVYHRLIGPYLRRRDAFTVEDVVRESRNVWTLVLKPPANKSRFDFIPGQFQFLTFYRGRGLPVEEHPFTISSSPVQENHTSTIKESGDFTTTISKTKKGDKIAVQGPFGRFSYVLHPDETDLVFIAGGIGITPMMSMLRHMRDIGVDMIVLLLYANSTEQDILFRDELERITSGKNPQLTVVHVLSRPGDGWSGEQGHIDANLIKKYAERGLQNKAFYVCGPPAMMTAIISVLIELGVPSNRIRSERFAL